MGTTTGELALTTYAAGERPWSHSSGLTTIDTQVTRLLRGRFKAAGTLGDGDTTPTIQNLAVVYTGSASPTEVSDFDDGSDEQLLLVIGADGGNTTVAHDGTNIDLAGDQDYVLADGKALLLWLNGTTWREVTRTEHSFAGLTGTISTAQLGTGTADQTVIAAAAVGRGELKTSTEAEAAVLSLTGFGSFTAFSSVGTYGFFPTYSTTGMLSAMLYVGRVASGSPSSAATRLAYEVTAGSGTFTVTCRYVTATPPHKMAGVGAWGSFLFLLRNEDGSLERIKLMDDPPWYFRNKGALPKNHPRRFLACPHPWSGDPIADGRSVEIVNLSFLEDRFMWCEGDIWRMNDPDIMEDGKITIGTKMQYIEALCQAFNCNRMGIILGSCDKKVLEDPVVLELVDAVNNSKDAIESEDAPPGVAIKTSEIRDLRRKLAIAEKMR
jgi:hypothetical protein